MMDTTVYTAVKAPMKGLHDLQKCRIGLCNGTPTLEDGWILFSSLITDDAEKIYAAVRKTDLHRLPQGNYDAGDDSWLVPIFVLDGWMTSKEELIHLKSTVRHPVQYFRHCDEGKGTSCLDYIDFIDAPAVRDHLRRLPPLPPAQQCILIAQSYIRPLTDKLAALNAIRDATPPEDFSRGCWKFQCDDPFPVILDRYLRTRAERLVTFRKAEPGVVYVVESGYRNDSALFSTFDAALASDDGRAFIVFKLLDRSGDTEPHYRDTVELTIEAAPRFNGGTGDLSPDDVQTIRDLVARHLDAFLANWDGKMSSDDLLAALRGGTRPDDNNCFDDDHNLERAVRE